MKIVLGGGIAGLIWAYYNPDYIIVSPEIGGQFNSHFPLGPRYLHNNVHASRFLKDLGIARKLREIKIGYWLNGFITPNRVFRKLYYQKSRAIDSLEGFDDSVMNNNLKSFLVLEVDFDTIINRLEKSITEDRILRAKAESINLTTKKLFLDFGEDIHRELEYENLVSTIPKNIFLRLCGLPSEKLKSIPVTYVVLKNSYFKFWKNDFVYFAGDETPEHRLTKCGDFIVADIAGAHTEEDLKQYYQEFYVESKVVPGIQIVSGNVDIRSNGLKLLGRYGTWNHRYKTEDIIEIARGYRDGKTI